MSDLASISIYGETLLREVAHTQFIESRSRWISVDLGVLFTSIRLRQLINLSLMSLIVYLCKTIVLSRLVHKIALSRTPGPMHAPV